MMEFLAFLFGGRRSVKNNDSYVCLDISESLAKLSLKEISR